MSISEETLDRVRACMKTAKAPGHFDKVYKDECMLSFDTPFSEGGLFVSLTSWFGFGKEKVKQHQKKSGEKLYLFEQWTKVFKPKEEIPEATKMGIGIEGGFAGTVPFEIVKEHSLALIDNDEVVMMPLCQDLPALILQVCDAVIASEGVAYKEDVAAWEDVDAQTDSKYAADLLQLEDAPKISPDPSTWEDAATGAKENLWLNLSTGYIGGGRKNYDGSGGSGSALDHFKATGNKYPLVVKLGTITAQGADVYSYAPDEDRSCRDSKLAEHLSHFGIDVMKQEKTVKTTTELTLEMNNKYEGSKILENNSELVPVYGPGFQGLTNIGNSCYMASVLQTLFSMPEFVERYGTNAEKTLSTASGNYADDVLAQLAKLGSALCSGTYSKEGEADNPAYEVRPRMLKSLIARGHQEFSSSRQQDAQEYLEYFIEQLKRVETRDAARLEGGQDIESLFAFDTVERWQCNTSKKVRYTTHTERMLKLSVPMQAAVNSDELEAFDERQAKKAKKDEDEEKPLPIVPFDAVLQRFAAEDIKTDWYSPAAKEITTATTFTRFKTFPKYVVMYLQRYYASETWEPKKLEVVVPMPEELDLTHLRGTSQLKDGEEALPEGEAPVKKEPAIEPDEEILAQLVSMGFDLVGCQKACVAVKNSSADAAMEWVLQHMGDPDFAVPPSDTPKQEAVGVKPEDVDTLMAITGFDAKRVTKALKATDGNTERAADWLFSHPDDDGEEETGGKTELQLSDGGGKYALTGMISHIGKNTGCGHYVAHLKKGGDWYLFNDEKVAKSENPPFGLAYIYIYKRLD